MGLEECEVSAGHVVGWLADSWRAGQQVAATSVCRAAGPGMGMRSPGRRCRKRKTVAKVGPWGTSVELRRQGRRQENEPL